LLALALTACTSLKQLSPADRLPPDDRVQYVILAALSPASAADYSNQPGPDARSAYLDWYWQHAAPPQPRSVYVERARHARDLYGAQDLTGDDRVIAYIRHGPARRETFEPRPAQSDTVRVYISPAEIWTYDSLGLQLDFVRTGVAYKLVGTSRFGPQVRMPALEPVDLDLPAPEPRPDAQPLGLELALYRLGQNGDSVEVEVQYGLAQRELSRAFPPGTQARLHLRLDLAPRRNGARTTIARWLALPGARDTGAAPAVGLERLVLPADVYAVTLSAVSAGGRAAQTRRAELNLVDYVRRAQPTSDIAFYSLADSSFQSPQFNRSGWPRLVPLCTTTLPSGSACYIMYELYNLGLDSAGNHEVEADYDFIEESTRQLAVPASPRRYVTGPGPTARVVERMHTMNLRPGSYLIVARVRDVAADRPLSLTTTIRIAPR
jgi:hypothetical protein